MYPKGNQGKGSKGSVQFKSTKGRLQIVFSYLVEEDSEIRRKRFYISTGYEDTPLNRQLVGDTVRTIQRDIDYGEVDLSLRKYKPAASLTTDSSIPPISPNASTQSQLTLSELWEKYSQFKRHQVSPSTYYKDFTKHKNHISRLPSDKLEDAGLIRDYLLENLTLDAARRCLTQVKACCKWAVDEKLIEVNPFLAMTIKKPKGSDEDNDINPFSKAERDLIIETFLKNKYYKHYTNYVKFLFSTGARPSEVAALQWKHVDGTVVKFRQSIVVSEDGLVLKQGLKTQKKRDFPINSHVRAILDDLKPEIRDPEAFLFSSPKGGFLDQHNFSTRAWKSVLGACNVPHRKSYQCRHTFISLCAEENISSILIGRWVGTSAEMIDKHYGATNFPNSKPPDLT
ncbi:MAG: site-specific integrase [Drouetiella hepatica Uher 2000/2452]|jgi:integrase|uniref:Site-specific integrase n=1 Tax=Drouetiella hepatica Uher 2000/2452 TaxID=904376 RepID=A0A951UQA6_9CYAN|nr:site-specific integrase [Drouetiella hepatica Uher 2000/2452]